jgi:hypothetical protein
VRGNCASPFVTEAAAGSCLPPGPAAATSLTAPPPLPAAPNPDHFQCYVVKGTSGTPRFTPVLNVPLADQFASVRVDVRKPVRLCLAVDTNGEDPGAPAHPGVVLCYQAKPARGSPKFAGVNPIFANNPFGPQTMRATKLKELCVPSTLEPA